MYSGFDVYEFEYFLFASKNCCSSDNVVTQKQSNRRGYLNLIPTSYDRDKTFSAT